MAQVKFGMTMVEIDGKFTINGQEVDASAFVGKLLGQIEVLKTGHSSVPLGQGGTAQTSPSAVPPPSMPMPSSTSSSPSTSGTSGTSKKCVSCGSLVPIEDLCPDCGCCYDGCCECEEQEANEEADDDEYPSVISNALNSIANSGATVVQVGSPNSFPILPVGHAPTATAVQPAKPSTISGKPGDEFGW